MTQENLNPIENENEASSTEETAKHHARRYARYALEQLEPMVKEFRSREDWPEMEMNVPMLLFEILMRLKVGGHGIIRLLGDDAFTYLAELGYLVVTATSADQPDEKPEHS